MNLSIRRSLRYFVFSFSPKKASANMCSHCPFFFSCFFLSGIEILFTGSLETDSDLLENPAAIKQPLSWIVEVSLQNRRYLIFRGCQSRNRFLQYLPSLFELKCLKARILSDNKTVLKSYFKVRGVRFSSKTREPQSSDLLLDCTRVLDHSKL